MTPADRLPWRRLPLLLPGLLALLSGLAAGLWRLGAWPADNVPLLLARAAAGHGALMVCGFFGTVISLERAVALGAHGRDLAWAWAAPAAAGLGTLLWLAGQAPAALVAWALASLGLLAASLWVGRRQPEGFVAVLILGAAAWLLGNGLLLAGRDLARVVPCWVAFLAFTIAGERLELSRLMPRPLSARRLFAAILAVLLASLLGLAGAGPQAAPLAAAGWGAGWLALALWLLRHDVARRTVRQPGLPRYIACSLLAGHVWLGLGGLLMLRDGALQPGTAAWDAALHAVLLGFVVSMVFGHAPIVLPAVLRISLVFRRRCYAPLLLLHLSVLARVAGDLLGQPLARRLGAWGAALALLGFMACMASLVRRRRPSGSAMRSPSTSPSRAR